MAASASPGGGDRPERTLVARFAHWPLVAAGIPLDRPALVLQANRVVAATPAARAEGVATGMRRREAQGCCPDAEVLAHAPDRDARAFEPVVAALDALCPRVEVTRPGTVALATRGPSRWAGGDQALADQALRLLATALAERVPGGAPGATVQVGVADGAFAAWVAAGDARPVSPGGGTWAGVTVVVPPGGSAALLASRPVTLLADLGEAGLGVERVLDVLGRLGLRTVGAVAALPVDAAIGRFGPDGLLLHRLARGLDPRPLDARRPAEEQAVALELDPPAERVETAAFVAVTLADRLHAALAGQGLAATRVAVAAETEHGEHIERTWRDEGTLTSAALAERLRWQLDGWLTGPPATRPTAGISRLTLTPVEVVVARGRQLGFWGGETRLDEHAARALGRVQALLGPEAVVVPEQRGGRGPGERIGLVPVAALDLTEPRPAARPGWVAEPWPGSIPPPAPARVPREAVPAELLDAAGEPVGVSGRGVVSAAPARVDPGDGRLRVVRAWGGPWPSEERWWDPAAHRRRARVQVVDEDGVAHLLALERGRWWREATYD